MSKKIIFRKAIDGKIYSVESPLRYKDKFTEEQVLQKIEDYNKTAKKGVMLYQVVDVDDNIAELFEFLLGEGNYKRTHDIEDICDSIDSITNHAKDIESTVEECANAICSMLEGISQIKDNIKNLSNKE